VLKGCEEFKNIPVIMLTARKEREWVQMGIEAGAFYYLTKPVNKPILRSILKAAITDYEQIRKMQREIQVASNPFENLREGHFQFRTGQEGGKLAVFIANATPNPNDTLIISELIQNAIEHGNLGIGYQEKTKLLDRDALGHEIDRRLHMPEFQNKHASLHFHRNGNHITIRIEDQGKGFDFSKYLTFDESRVFDSHGRGIAMANTFLNIQYKGNGNQVEVHIPLQEN